MHERLSKCKVFEWKIEYKIKDEIIKCKIEFEAIKYNTRLLNVGLLNIIKDSWIQDYQI